MNHLFMSILSLLLTFSPIMQPYPTTLSAASSTQCVNGTIILDDMETIEIWPAKDKSKTILLHVTPASYIADAVSGRPAALGERKDDTVVAYYKADGFGVNNAVALIINIPEDFSPPVYARAARVSRVGDQTYVLTDGGVIVTITDETSIEPFLTGDLASMDDIAGNSDLLLWNQAYNMSIPARTAANRVVILGQSKPEGSPGIAE